MLNTITVIPKTLNLHVYPTKKVTNPEAGGCAIFNFFKINKQTEQATSKNQETEQIKIDRQYCQRHNLSEDHFQIHLHLKFFSIRTSAFYVSLPFMILVWHLHHIFLLLKFPSFNPFLPVNISEAISIQILRWIHNAHRNCYAK